MADSNSHQFPSDELIESIQGKNVSSSLNQIKRMLVNMHSSEIAHSLESLPPKERKLLWSMIEIQDEGEIIAELNDEIQQELIGEISTDDRVIATLSHKLFIKAEEKGFTRFNRSKEWLKENEVLFCKAQWFMMDSDIKNKGFIKVSSSCYQWVNEKLDKGKGW